MQEIKHSSLRESVLASIGDFLYEEDFQRDAITKEGILQILSLIADYHEEGKPLYPEVLITNSLDFFKTIPNKELVINEAGLSVVEFQNAIKLCAPLATNSWIIFIEVKSDKIKYGLISAEMTETSPSIYNQTVGKLKIEYPDTTIAYIKNLGQKTVELCGLKKRCLISLTLDKANEQSLKEISTLSSSITEKCDEKIISNISTYFEKLIDDALKIGHGNLIGVVDDDEKVIEEMKQKLKVNGHYLPTPIDFESLIGYAEDSKDSESSINLSAYGSVLKTMLNHDGITVLTNRGRVLGYHLLIDSYIVEGDVLSGGSRSKAFLSMKNCKHFKCCFYKSQDGNIKIWTNE